MGCRAASEFDAWGPVPLDGADPDEVDALVARGCIGTSVPAGALSAGPVERLGPVLERVAKGKCRCFVHPGARRDSGRTTSKFGEPLWWRALTDYVSQMQAAWVTFAALGRRSTRT